MLRGRKRERVARRLRPDRRDGRLFADLSRLIRCWSLGRFLDFGDELDAAGVDDDPGSALGTPDRGRSRPLRTLTTLDRFGLVQWRQGRPTLRMLQVPEIKRGMGLPDRFELNHGTRRDRIKLLGNGVCAPVMRKVVSTLLRGEVRSRPWWRPATALPRRVAAPHAATYAISASNLASSPWNAMSPLKRTEAMICATGSFASGSASERAYSTLPFPVQTVPFSHLQTDTLC